MSSHGDNDMAMPDPSNDTFERDVAALFAQAAANHEPADGRRLAADQRSVPGPAVTPSRWSPARLAYWFYGTAATGAVIGQTWVAVEHLSWGAHIPFAVRVLAVLPFAICLELLAMALAAMADERMRHGERAYGFRASAAVVAVVAIGIQVTGHWPDLYWSGVFGVLSGSAYLLWALHSAARRRDALRAAGKLADTAPDYGLWRRIRHPMWTARAAELAREGRIDAASGRWRPLGLYESLRAAESAIRDEKRRPAVAAAVEQVVRCDQRDPRMAEVAVRTLDLDRLAAELARRVDYSGWADRLTPAITAPAAAPAALSTPPPKTSNQPAAPVPAADSTDGAPRTADHTTTLPAPAVPASSPQETPVETTPVGAEPRGVEQPPGTEQRKSQPALADVASTVTGSTATNGEALALPSGDADGPAGGEAPTRSQDPPPHDDDERQDDEQRQQDASGSGEDDADVAADAGEEREDDDGASGDEAAQTAQAVAYWLARDPSLTTAAIAKKVGKSRRTVSRYMPSDGTAETGTVPSGGNDEDPGPRR